LGQAGQTGPKERDETEGRRLLMYKRFERIHFTGIGGIGMSGIAEVLNNLDYDVTGSDLKESETTSRLRKLGISINIGHRAKNIKGAHVVVISSAVSQDNPEVEEARKQSIPVIPRAEMLAELARLKYGVLVAGAHGKTTTTSLVASVLGDGRLDPTVVIGGKLKGIGSNAKLGQGDFLVAEADESDGSFLKLTPTIAVVTNIDREHLDFFNNISEIKEAFLSFINKVPFYGLCILYGDNGYIQELIPKIERRFITYGLTDGLDLVAKDIKTKGLKSDFEAILNGKSLGSFEVPLIGTHNVCNCLAAIAVANELGMDIDVIRRGLANFSGVHRRFEFKGNVYGINVIDDYGHHPAEIMATLRAAKDSILQGTGNGTGIVEKQGGKGRLVVIFQPHRYTRTRDLLSEFFDVFTDADEVILMDIYPAGEKPISGINAEALLRGIRDRKKETIHMKDRMEIIGFLGDELREGDTLLTLGAGDVWKIGEEFLKVKGLKHRDVD
jgi:UDP-N-acetylmuramate--alanine ligase